LTRRARGRYAAQVKRVSLHRLRSFVVAAALLGGCNTQYDNPFANTSPTLAPPADANIMYTSNGYTTRPGSPREVFAVAASGAGVTRLTYCNNDTRHCDTVEAAPAPDRTRVSERRVDDDTDKDGQLTTADGEALIVLDLTRGVEGGLLPSNAKVSGIDWSPAGDVLVYAATGEGGVEDLYRADPNGQNTRNLTSTPGIRERRIRIDPAGSAAVYERIDATGKGQIWLFSSTGAQVKITSGGEGSAALAGTPYVVGSDADPDYSPDGRSFVFRRLTATGNGGLGTWDIMTARLDGTALATIATGPAYRGAPDWGSRGIVFPETDVAAAATRLVIVQGDGSGRQVPVTLGSSFLISYPRWLP
jgi:dipeptidyl aminopeptidase/acylaminoacyl peptidase